MAIKGSSKKGSKGKEEAKGAQVTARLYRKDEKQFMSIAKNDFKGNEAEATRELISEALTNRRLRTIGRDTSLTAVKEAQHEVIAGETDEMKGMLKDLLAMARGSGTSVDRVVNQNREIYGVIFHVLRKVLNIEDIAQEHIARPALAGDGKKDSDITSSFIEAEQEWSGQAQTLLESVRTQLSQTSA